MFSRRSSGVLLHPGSLPGGTLGPEAYRFVDWLEAAGQSWWQILPLGPPDRYGSPYAARSAFAGWAGLCAEPDAAVSPEEIEAFRALHGYWLDDWAAYARKGAVADQVRFEREWLALRALRRRTRDPADRRHPAVRRRPERRRRLAPRAVRPQPDRRRPTGSVHGDRPALGEPDLRLARAPGGGLPLVDRALPADVRARGHRPSRPLPRLRRLLGGPGRSADGRERPLAARAGTRAVPGRRGRARSGCR